MGPGDISWVIAGLGHVQGSRLLLYHFLKSRGQDNLELSRLLLPLEVGCKVPHEALSLMEPVDISCHAVVYTPRVGEQTRATHALVCVQHLLAVGCIWVLILALVTSVTDQGCHSKCRLTHNVEGKEQSKTEFHFGVAPYSFIMCTCR